MNAPSVHIHPSPFIRMTTDVVFTPRGCNARLKADEFIGLALVMASPRIKAILATNVLILAEAFTPRSTVADSLAARVTSETAQHVVRHCLLCFVLKNGCRTQARCRAA